MKLHQYIIVLGMLALAACGSPAPTAPAATPAASGGTIQISDPWARPMAMASAMEEPTMSMGSMEEPTKESGEAMGSMEEPTKESGEAMGGEMNMDMSGANSAAYMVIRNTGSEPDKLIGVRGDVAKTLELHTVIDNNGMMQMRPVEGGIDVPAGGEVELKPGGYHVMMIGLNRDLKEGETVQLTLEFEKAGEIPVTAQIRQP